MSLEGVKQNFLWPLLLKCCLCCTFPQYFTAWHRAQELSCEPSTPSQIPQLAHSEEEGLAQAFLELKAALSDGFVTTIELFLRHTLHQACLG